MHGCARRASPSDARPTPVTVRRRGLLAIVVAVALVLAVGRAWGALIGDRAWFDALGFGDVWWWRTSVSLTLKCVAGTIATLAMRMHLEAIRRSFVSVVVPGTVGNLEFTGAVPDRTISAVLWLAALVVGVLLTVPLDDWAPLAGVLDAQPFSEADPYFQRDLAFWTAWLPFELQTYAWALLAHAVMSMLTVLGYVLTRGVGTEGRALRVTRHARRHITVLGALLLLLIAWSYRIDGFDRLVHGTGGDGAFGFADHRVGLPGGIVLQVICIAAAFVVTWSAWSLQPRAGIAAVTTVLLMALLLRQGMPLIADSIDTGGTPEARERPYFDAGASFTRRAYEADRVIAALPGDTASLATTPLWDRSTLPNFSPARLGSLLGWSAANGMPEGIAFEQLQRNGLLPTWHTVPVDLFAREPFRLVTSTTGRTLPPIVTSDSGRGYALVSDPDHRIAAPSIESGRARLAHAWNQQNPRLLFGRLPSPSPVLVTERDVRTRVALLAPTLHPSTHVSPLLYADSLYWIVDLYATSGTYPLSEHVVLDGQDVAAAQFAATAIVNAHSGRLTIATDRPAPVLARRALERLARHVLPMAALPEVLRRALPPRADALAIEGAIAARHGSRAVQDDTSGFSRRGGALVNLALVQGEPSDSSIATDDDVPVWLTERRVFARTSAAVDVRGAVRGVLIAPGGDDRRTRWMPSPEAAPYDAILRATRDVSDSLRQPGSLTGARRGSTRVVPGTGTPRFLTPFFALRDGRPSQLSAVLISDGLRKGVAGDVPDAAVTWHDGARSAVPSSAAASQYRQMREALRRGAWTEFGASFEALGRALGVARDSTPR